MRAPTVRRVVAVVCALGVVGMIVSAVARALPAVLASGLVTSAAILCLLVAVAVSEGMEPSEVVLARAEQEGAAVESMVSSMTLGGADEGALRALVAAAVRLGRSLGP
ncbi:MAG: hypothetical protein ACRDYD_02185 [Acidimicrobiales bacterium]